MRRLIGLLTTPIAALVALLGILLLLLVPGLHRRRTLARWTGRAAVTAGGCPIRVTGAENLPAGHCILVANHASYLDGIVMQGVMPDRFAFVVKREAGSVPLIGLMLRRLGAVLVDRSGVASRGDAGREILARADDGEALAVFPEGTFRGQPGLGAFRAGAFLTAISAGVPVVPAIIRGTRAALPEGRWAMIPNRVQVEILAPVPPPPPGPGQARRYAATVRSVMLEALGEPDLTVPTP